MAHTETADHQKTAHSETPEDSKAFDADVDAIATQVLEAIDEALCDKHNGAAFTLACLRIAIISAANAHVNPLKLITSFCVETNRIYNRVAASELSDLLSKAMLASIPPGSIPEA